MKQAGAAHDGCPFFVRNGPAWRVGACPILETSMRYRVLSSGLLVLLFGCGDRRIASPSQSEQPGGDGQRNHALNVPVPSQFSVDVRLSDTARNKLIESNETIIVAVYFTGHPKPGTEARYLDIKSGDVVLGDVKHQEIHPGETAIFSELNLNTDALTRIDSQGPHILADVYSGRRSSKDNLLDCDYYDGSLESIRGQTIVIRCQLIGERPYR